MGVTWKGFERWKGLGFIVIEVDIMLLNVIFRIFCLNINF